MDLPNDWTCSNGQDPFSSVSLLSSLHQYTGQDIIKLANELHRKQLFINSEKEILSKLSCGQSKVSENLFQSSWINGKLRLNVDQLLACGPDQNPGLHCLHAITLDNVFFKEASKKLPSLSEEFRQLIVALRNKPDFVANLLYEGESNNVGNLSSVISTVMSTLYSSCLLPEDQRLVLSLLKELLNLQVSTCDNPRRLLRQGSCAFYRVYKIFIENLRSARLFLIAALRESVMFVLIEDDLYLEIDPDNPQIRFTPEHRSRHPINESNLTDRDQTLDKLIKLVKKFIEGINNNISSFPDDLCWLIRQLYSSLTSRKSDALDSRETSVICSELIFVHFICHAIVNPEQYGIVDTFISDVARFNLMQIAQIIQSLVLNNWEQLDSKYKDLCSKIPVDCISSTLELIFQDLTSDPFPSVYSVVCDISRAYGLITEHDLCELVNYLFHISKVCRSIDTRKMLSQLLSKIPESSFANVLCPKGVHNASKSGNGSGEEVNLGESIKSKRGLLKRVTRRKQDNETSNSQSVPANASANANDDTNSDTLLTEVLVFGFLSSGESSSSGIEILSEDELFADEFSPSTRGQSYSQGAEEKLISIIEDDTLRDEAKILSHILSNVDVQMFDVPLNHLKDETIDSDKLSPKIEAIIKTVLAEKIFTDRQFDTVAIQELIRHIQSWNKDTLPALMDLLREESQQKTAYLNYLFEHHQSLVANNSIMKNVISHLVQEKSVCNYILVSQCVRFYTNGKEKELDNFIKEFQKLVASDEKAQLVDKFLTLLFNDMGTDRLWQIVTEEQFEYGIKLVERYVMGQIYPFALYPNGDGDIYRDQILQKHIQALSGVISPSHNDLRIPVVYHSQCPWESVQKQISTINAYKTPREKVDCVVKCCKMLMNLLSLAHRRSIPSADDMIPVLVYVLIKANPSWLLSNVQYVNCFYDKHLEGEQAYWWTQFSSAVEFVKTMDY